MSRKVDKKKNPFEGKQVVFVEDERDERNADGVRGHLEIVGESETQNGLYVKLIKRLEIQNFREMTSDVIFEDYVTRFLMWE